MLSTAIERLLKRETEEGARRLFSNGAFPDTGALKSFADARRAEIYKAHRRGAVGSAVCRANSDVVDIIVRGLYGAFVKSEGNADFVLQNFCVVALGGYGRRELCPKSDIDIMFLYSSSAVGDDFKSRAIDKIMYPLWNIGYKLGHSSRTVAETVEDAKADVLIKTSMLDARYICGSKSVFGLFEADFEKTAAESAQSHIDELLRLKTARHQKYGWVPYVQEPNIKNGVGGLRDLQTIVWIARLKNGARGTLDMVRHKIISVVEYKNLRRANNFLLRIRNEMHYELDRENDLLDLESQPKYACGLGYGSADAMEGVERFMSDVYFAMREVDLILKTARKRMKIVLPEDVEETMGIHRDNFSKVRYIDGFILKNGFIYAQEPTIFRKDPTLLIKVFRCMQKFEVALSDEIEILIRDSAHLIDDSVRQNKEANSEFTKILLSQWNVYPILSKMHFLDVLGKFIPEFGDITCLVQHEYYHRYTTDIHTLATIAELDKVFGANVEDIPYGYYHSVLSSAKNAPILYFALLLHDLGKSDGIKGHAEAGAELAPKILERFDIADDDKETIVFLIRNHLMMARFWQSNDIEDEAVIAKFAEKIGDAERLKYLYVLTFCDSMGTSSTLWNSYKQSLHTLLYRNTVRRLEKDEEQMEAFYEERRQSIIDRVLNSPEIETSKEEVLAHFENLPRKYFVFHGIDDILLHLNLAHIFAEALKQSPENTMPVFEWRNDPNMSMSTITIVSEDRGGLFYKLASALTYTGLNILGSKALSRTDGIIIDTFYVTNAMGGAVENERTRQLFSKAIAKIFMAGVDLVPAKKPNPDASQRIPNSVVLKKKGDKIDAEIIARDWPGLLCNLAKAIYLDGYDIQFARIGVDGIWGTNVFQLKRRAGAPEVSEDKLIEDIRAAI